MYELPQHERRLCKVVSKAKRTATSVNVVSTEKLLEASLNSLQSMGRQMHAAGTNSTSMAIGFDGDSYAGDLSLSHSQAQSPTRSRLHQQAYPNESYLRGAMWLGRNFTILSEELAEEMDDFRTKFMSEVAVASQDTDARRCCHRLTLLANSGITQAHSMTNNTRIKIREILQGASALTPGDSKAFKILLRSLPIESALTSSGNTPAKSPANNHVTFGAGNRTTSPQSTVYASVYTK